MILKADNNEISFDSIIANPEKNEVELYVERDVLTPTVTMSARILSEFGRELLKKESD